MYIQNAQKKVLIFVDISTIVYYNLYAHAHARRIINKVIMKGVLFRKKRPLDFRKIFHFSRSRARANALALSGIGRTAHRLRYKFSLKSIATLKDYLILKKLSLSIPAVAGFCARSLRSLFRFSKKNPPTPLKRGRS